MKAALLIGGIGFLLFVALLVWALFTGVAHLSDRLPQWMSGAAKVAEVAIQETKKAIPWLQDQAAGVSPAIQDRIKEIIPGQEIPAKDVGGEDISGVPRAPAMVRVSFKLDAGRRTVGYRGAVEHRTVMDFYSREMAALGFKKRVLTASPTEEIHEFRRGKRALEFRFTKTDRLGMASTDLTIREL